MKSAVLRSGANYVDVVALQREANDRVDEAQNALERMDIFDDRRTAAEREFADAQLARSLLRDRWGGRR